MNMAMDTGMAMIMIMTMAMAMTMTMTMILAMDMTMTITMATDKAMIIATDRRDASASCSLQLLRGKVFVYSASYTCVAPAGGVPLPAAPCSPCVWQFFFLTQPATLV